MTKIVLYLKSFPMFLVLLELILRMKLLDQIT